MKMTHFTLNLFWPVYQPARLATLVFWTEKRPTFYREAKKAEVGEQAHNLLAAIHNSFEEISEKILATDRARREATDLETKLSGIAARSLNIDQLQADLDAIRKENEYFQSRLGNP